MEETTQRPADSAARYEGRTDKITDAAHIAALLARLKNERVLLTVNIPGIADSYSSAVLAAYPGHGYFVMDELSPSSGNSHLPKTNRLRIHARLKGVELSFEAPLDSVGSQDGVAYYNLTIPGVLSYRQQRAHYRARVSRAKTITVWLRRDTGEELSGELNDVSVGGIGIRFTTRPETDFITGEDVPRCRFRLPGGEEITCHVEIRFQSVAVTGTTRMLGARFIGLSPPQQAAIARFVASLDRELARRTQQVRD
jgi:c-di-GMP-binding flagellar brake protein YcgR